MYHFVCFILLVSLEGLRADNSTNISTTVTVKTTAVITSKNPSILSALSTPPQSTSTSKSQTIKQHDCLFNLKDSKEMFLFSIISLLLLICLFLLVITCLVCKRCRGARSDELVVMKSSTITRRNNVNGGPSETDIMLKGCGSVNVEIEAALEESQDNGVSGEEHKNSANESGEVAPTHEDEQAGEPDQKEEDGEKAE